DLDERGCQVAHHGFVMRGSWREAQAFGTARNGREIDRLHIDAIFGEEYVADLFRAHRIADHQRNDVRGRIHYGQARISKALLEESSRCLLSVALHARLLEVAHACKHASDEHRPQTGGENEAGRVAANDVDDILVSRDIAAHDAECLAERSLDDVDAVRGLVAIGSAASARA